MCQTFYGLHFTSQRKKWRHAQVYVHELPGCKTVVQNVLDMRRHWVRIYNVTDNWSVTQAIVEHLWRYLGLFCCWAVLKNDYGHWCRTKQQFKDGIWEPKLTQSYNWADILLKYDPHKLAFALITCCLKKIISSGRVVGISLLNWQTGMLKLFPPCTTT